MADWISEPTRSVLARLSEMDRGAILAQAHQRTRSTDIFEALTLLGGPLGLNWLYLRQLAPFFTRLCHTFGALVVLVTGACWLHVPLVSAGLAYLALVLILWVTDYVTLERSLDRYHARLDAVLHRRLAALVPQDLAQGPAVG